MVASICLGWWWPLILLSYPLVGRAVVLVLPFHGWGEIGSRLARAVCVGSAAGPARPFPSPGTRCLGARPRGGFAASGSGGWPDLGVTPPGERCFVCC